MTSGRRSPGPEPKTSMVASVIFPSGAEATPPLARSGLFAVLVAAFDHVHDPRDDQKADRHADRENRQ